MNNNELTFLMQMISGGNNPQQLIQQMISQNPQLQVILNQAQQSGLSPKDYVMQYARQNNINIQPILKLLNQRGIKIG